MDPDQKIIDEFNAREEEKKAYEFKIKKSNLERHSTAAKNAHKIRQAHRILYIISTPSWEEMDLLSKNHLISDAENVAKNPSITLDELTELYRDRIIKSGDTENPDLGKMDPDLRSVEELVLNELKKHYG